MAECRLILVAIALCASSSCFAGATKNVESWWPVFYLLLGRWRSEGPYAGTVTVGRQTFALFRTYPWTAGR